MTTKWKIMRHQDDTCWLIIRNGEVFTTRPSRSQARECVRQERALEKLSLSQEKAA